MLYAVRGLRGPEGTYFRLETGERLKLHDSGRSVWVSGSGHKRLVRMASSGKLEGVLNKLMTQAPE